MRLVAMLAGLVLAAPALATTANGVSVETLARVSDVVARGRVRSVSARWSDGHRRISTRIRIDRTNAWRGKLAKSIDVVVPGGAVGHLEQRVEGAPAFAVGEDVVLFLNRTGRNAYTVEGLAQGKFSVQRGIAVPDLSHVRFVSVLVGPGERRAEAMPVAELERRVRSIP